MNREPSCSQKKRWRRGVGLVSVWHRALTMSQARVFMILLLLLLGNACESLRLGGGMPRPTVEILKKDVLSAVAALRRGTEPTAGRANILAAVDRLEASTDAAKKSIRGLDGRWSLVYSTRVADSANKVDSIVDFISSRLYKFFFRFLPFLAGSSGNDEFSSTSLAANIQEISLDDRRIINTVTIKSPLQLAIVVEGECEASPTQRISDPVGVLFTSFTINGLRIPLPRPKGTLRTTYCDDNLRISRGGQGGLFVVKRI